MGERVLLTASFFFFWYTEWIKGLLAVPFVLYSQPQGVFGSGASAPQTRDEAHRRYSEILRDVEVMIDDHSTLCIPRWKDTVPGGGADNF